MDYPCGNFVDCNFSRFGSIVQSDTQAHMTDAGERYTPATFVGVSKDEVHMYRSTVCTGLLLQ